MSQQQNDSWVTFGYEVEMFRRLLHDLGPGRQLMSSLPWEMKNAITECALLHARQLADILLSRTSETTDIKLREIMPGFRPTRFDELERVYGSRNSGICQILNKYAMHPTTLRTGMYDYTQVLQQLAEIIEHVVSEIEAKKGSKAVEWAGAGKAVPVLKLDTLAATHVPS